MPPRLEYASYRLILIFLVISTLVLTVTGCRKKRTELEQLTVERIGSYCRYLEEYKTEAFCYPDSWDILLRWKRMEMPINPYTNEPMISLDSAEFDPETSPGNIYYVKVVQEDCVINCQVIIFGERGEITRYSHAGPLVAK